MTKELKKSTIFGSKLKNIFNKNRTSFNWHKYKHQQNFCLNLLGITKNFTKVNEKRYADNNR